MKLQLWKIDKFHCCYWDFCMSNETGMVLLKKFNIQPPESVSCFKLLYSMLDGLVIFCKGGFHHVKCL